MNYSKDQWSSPTCLAHSRPLINSQWYSTCGGHPHFCFYFSLVFTGNSWNQSSYTPEDMGQFSVSPNMPRQESHSYKDCSGISYQRGTSASQTLLPVDSPQKWGTPVRDSNSKVSYHNAHINSSSLPHPVEEPYSQYVCDETEDWKRVVDKLLVSFISIHNIFPHKITTKHCVSTFYLLPKYKGFSSQQYQKLPTEMILSWRVGDIACLKDTSEFGKRILSMSRESERTKTSLRWYWYAPWNENHFYRRLLHALLVHYWYSFVTWCFK